MNHQARDEMNITGQPVQLGDGDRTTLPARLFKRGGKLRSPVDGIGPFAGLDLDVYATQLKAFGGGEPLQCLLLRHDCKAGFTLLVGRNPNVADKIAHAEARHEAEHYGSRRFLDRYWQPHCGRPPTRGVRRLTTSAVASVDSIGRRADAYWQVG